MNPYILSNPLFEPNLLRKNKKPVGAIKSASGSGLESSYLDHVGRDVIGGRSASIVGNVGADITNQYARSPLFNGSTANHLLIDNSDYESLQRDSFSICIGVRIDGGPGTYRAPFGGRQTGASNAGGNFFISNGNKLEYWYRFGGSWAILSEAGTSSVGDIVHAAVSISPNGCRLYKNGALEDSLAIAYTPSAGVDATIGCMNQNGIKYFAFNGPVFYVHFYSRELTGDDVLAVYNDHFKDIDTSNIFPFPKASAPPVGAVMNQIQKNNLGADLFNGTLM